MGVDKYPIKKIQKFYIKKYINQNLNNIERLYNIYCLCQFIVY